MIKSQLTKQHIGNTLKKLAEKTPLDKITVQEILDAGKISRKTFYYHFQDKQEVVVWIFRSELAEVVEKSCDPIILENIEESGKGDYARLPFYPNLFGSDPEMVFQSYFSSLLEYLYSNKIFYINAFQSTSQNNLGNYLYDLIYEYLLNDINCLLAAHNINDFEKGFVAQYFTCATAGMIITWVKNGMEGYPGNTFKYNYILTPITTLCLEFYVNYLIEKQSTSEKSSKKHTGYLEKGSSLKLKSR